MRKVVVAIILTWALAGCGQKAAPMSEAPDAGVEMTIHGVMRQKLEHSQSLLGDIARADFAAVESRALELLAMSQAADWLIHDTMTYLVLSEEFREVTRQMAADAAAQDLEGVNAQYGSMVDVCVRCHTYLRRERLVKDFPDKVSWAERWIPTG
jgi:cytochrome c556